MGDDELSDIRRKRMEQLQRQATEQQAMQDDMEQQRKRAESELQLALMQILEPEARERLNTIKLTKPEFARAIEQQLVQLAHSGRIRQKITDEQLKALLLQIAPQKKEFRITRK
ncbi:DNA-binding protein [Methanofollis tationis]|uniref:DNA-binding protein n=2 Tax=cellular organisms TaxID=131567 RepID=A0A831PI88_9BACT|nr:DNA-binding protein [Methanofollis tationis]NVO67639.1 DNA-binding protein [Methanofollis tationis]HDR46399.1 DNA-binding protein [Geoalkalibacter subterraneus]